jgi:GDP-L-fucose synthase
MDLKDKKILVTGKAGFLGGHLVAALEDRGVPRGNIHCPKAEELDLRLKINCEKAVEGMDVVFHLAGVTGGIEFHVKNPGSIYYDNVTMGVELMEAARKSGVKKFITAGSATEYPQNAPAPFREADLWVGNLAPSHIAYTTAKKMLSIQALSYRAQYGFNAVHLLLTNLYGPRAPWAGDHVIPSTIRRIFEAKQKGEQTFEVWGTGKPTRDFLYAEDAAKAFVMAAEKYDKSDPVNIASGREASIRELVTAIAGIMEFSGEIVYNTAKPDGSPRRALDVTKAEREFGFRAGTDLKTGLIKTIEWALANRPQ